jgi:hypothetical protein
MDPNPDTPATQPSPGLLRYVLGFLLVGAAWGLTTPFMRRAAVSSSSSSTPESRAWLEHPNTPWLKAKVWGVLYGVWDVLRNPAYAFPFLVNVTGSVWFFLLIGQAGECFCLLMWKAEVWWLIGNDRTQSYCAYYQLACFPLHRARRMVGREEGYHKRSVILLAPCLFL